MPHSRALTTLTQREELRRPRDWGGNPIRHRGRGERQPVEQVALAHGELAGMARTHELAHADGTSQDHAGTLGLQAHDPAALLQRKRGKPPGQLIRLVKRKRLKMDERRVIGVESRVDGDKRRDRTTHADKALRIACLGGEAGFESLATERASLLQRRGRGWILPRKEEVRHAATAHIQRTHSLKRHAGSLAVEHPCGHLGRSATVIRNDDARGPKVLGNAKERE